MVGRNINGNNKNGLFSRHSLSHIYRCLAFRLSVAQLRASDHDDHCAIVRAIERRDPTEAREQMQRHIDRTFEAALALA